MPESSLIFSAEVTGLEQSILTAYSKGQRGISQRPLNIKINDNASLPLGRISGKVNEFDRALNAATQRVVTFGAAMAVINIVRQNMENFFRTNLEVEASLVKINVNLNQTKEGLRNFGKQIFDIAKSTGQSFNETAKAAEEFARQGLGAQETSKRLKDALILVRLAGISATEATQSLTAMVNSYSKEALTSSEIVNKLIAIDTKFAVSSKDLEEALSRVGSTASDAGVSFDQLIALVTSAQQITQRGGSVIGNALKTIFTRVQQPKTLKDLEDLGVAVRNTEGQMLPTIQILQNLAKAYDNLSQPQQAVITREVAGVYQMNILRASLRDLNKEYSYYGDALNTAANATDEAYRKNNKLNETLEAMVNTSKVLTKQLFTSISDAGVSDKIKAAVDTYNRAIKGLVEQPNNSIGKYFADSFIKGISNILTGPALTGLSVILSKVLYQVSKETFLSLKNFVSINTESQKRAVIQEKINSLLAVATNEERSQLNNATTAIEKRNIFLNIERRITEQLERQALAMRSIENQFLSEAALIKTPYTPRREIIGNFGRPLMRAAGGYDSLTEEEKEISRGIGGASASARPVIIPNFAYGDGKTGPIVANTDEYLVKGMNGMSIFNKEMINKYGLPPNAEKIQAAVGYPNLLAGEAIGKGSFGRVIRSKKNPNLVFKEFFGAAAENPNEVGGAGHEYSISKVLEESGVPVAKVFGSRKRSIARGGLFKEFINGSRLSELTNYVDGSLIENSLFDQTKTAGFYPADLHAGNIMVRGSKNYYRDLYNKYGSKRATEVALRNSVIVDPGLFDATEKTSGSYKKYMSSARGYIPNASRGYAMPNFASAYNPNVSIKTAENIYRATATPLDIVSPFHVKIQQEELKKLITKGLDIKSIDFTRSEQYIRTQLKDTIANALKLPPESLKQRNVIGSLNALTQEVLTAREKSIKALTNYQINAREIEMGIAVPKNIPKSVGKQWKVSTEQLRRALIHEETVSRITNDDLINIIEGEGHTERERDAAFETLARRNMGPDYAPTRIGENKGLINERIVLSTLEKRKKDFASARKDFGNIGAFRTLIGSTKRDEALLQKYGINPASDEGQILLERQGTRRFGARQNVAFATMFAAPFVAGFLPQGQGGTGSGIALGATSGALQGAGYGGIFGMPGIIAGTAIGGIIGAFSKLKESAQEVAERFDKINKTGLQTAEALDTISSLREQLAGTSNKQVKEKLAGQITEIINRLPEDLKQRALKGENLETLQEEQSKRNIRNKRITEIATGFAGLKDYGFFGGINKESIEGAKSTGNILASLLEEQDIKNIDANKINQLLKNAREGKGVRNLRLTGGSFYNTPISANFTQEQAEDLRRSTENLRTVQGMVNKLKETNPELKDLNVTSDNYLSTLELLNTVLENGGAELQKRIEQEERLAEMRSRTAPLLNILQSAGNIGTILAQGNVERKNIIGQNYLGSIESTLPANVFANYASEQKREQLGRSFELEREGLGKGYREYLFNVIKEKGGVGENELTKLKTGELGDLEAVVGGIDKGDKKLEDAKQNLTLRLNELSIKYKDNLETLEAETAAIKKSTDLKRIQNAFLNVPVGGKIESLSGYTSTSFALARGQGNTPLNKILQNQQFLEAYGQLESSGGNVNDIGLQALLRSAKSQRGLLGAQNTLANLISVPGGPRYTNSLTGLPISPEALLNAGQNMVGRMTRDEKTGNFSFGSGFVTDPGRKSLIQSALVSLYEQNEQTKSNISEPGEKPKTLEQQLEATKKIFDEMIKKVDEASEKLASKPLELITNINGELEVISNFLSPEQTKKISQIAFEAAKNAIAIYVKADAKDKTVPPGAYNDKNANNQKGTLVPANK